MLMTQMEIHSERAARRQSHSIRLFTLTGIIGSILFVLVFTIDSFLRPGYSPIFQVVSDLGVGQDEVRIFGAGVTVAAALGRPRIGRAAPLVESVAQRESAHAEPHP